MGSKAQSYVWRGWGRFLANWPTPAESTSKDDHANFILILIEFGMIVKNEVQSLIPEFREAGMVTLI